MTRYLKIAAKIGAKFVVVCLVLAVLFVAASSVSSAWQKSSPGKKVNELYDRNCVRCHGPDGRGDTAQGKVFNAPDFTNPDWWKKNASTASTKQLRVAVSKGKAGMPAFGKKLTRAEINLLVDRVRAFRK